MQRVVNFINLSGWIFLLTHVTTQLVFNPQDFPQVVIDLDVFVLRAVQLFQIVDILLILIGKSKGSILGGFFQILGRLIVALIFIQPDSNRFKFAAVVIAWAMADTNRYLYYLFKNELTGFLRYNAFLVLYPLGVYSEMLVINDYIKRHAEELEDWHVHCIRFVQGSIILGMIFLYRHMLKMRKRYFKSVGKGETKEGAAEESRSKSPKPKRN